MNTFLPDRIKAYLNERGLTDAVLERNKITWDGEKIVIPIFNADGLWIFNKYRRDPATGVGPKYTYDKGATSSLYGAEKLQLFDRVIVCEGEFDALILEAQGLTGVCSTGGAGTFKQDWFELMTGKELFMCFDNDDAGRKGMEKLARMHPDIKMIPLPREIGEHGDITDFFVRLGKTRKDFEVLMRVAEPIILPPEPKPEPRRAGSFDPAKNARFNQAKEVPLSALLKFNGAGFAHCPFHADKTPSFHWIKKTNRWHCFSCGENGDGIDLIMRTQNLTMKEAIDHLLKV